MTLNHLGTKPPLLALSLQTCTYSNSSPSLNFHAFPNWITVKFHYFLIGLKVKILNMFSSLVANYLTLLPLP
jgi:hypothetical protein